jgi:hypothetical protein
MKSQSRAGNGHIILPIGGKVHVPSDRPLRTVRCEECLFSHPTWCVRLWLCGGCRGANKKRIVELIAATDAGERDCMKKSQLRLQINFVLSVVVVLFVSTYSPSQSIADQKQTVAFIFGTVHPLNADKTPIKDALGKPLAVDIVLGTGFFVYYPDPRGGPTYGFVYLVTAKHVLRDTDGTFLPAIKVRLNLQSPTADPGFGFATLPVTDNRGNLLWLRGQNEADDVAILPFLPDQQTVQFKTIPIAMFVDEATLKTDAVEEGDNLYFIGLMAQYYGVKHNYPVRRGTLALMTDEQISTPTGRQKAFIAELQSWPGNSGSPVFLNLGGLRGNNFMLGQRLSFLGILAGGFLNQVTGNVVGGPEVVSGNSAEIGVSYVIPATRIIELLNSKEEQQRRDREVQQFLKSQPMTR